MDNLSLKVIAFNRTNIKEKTYPAKLICPQDIFFDKRGLFIAQRKLRSDFFQGIVRKPAHTSIGNADLIPAADIVEQPYFCAFM
jgi:hypothetical protein